MREVDAHFRLGRIFLLLLFLPTLLCTRIEQEATYTVLAPTTVRPNMLFKVAARVIKLEYEVMVISVVVKRTSYDGKLTKSICNGEHTFTRPGSFDITMQTPEEMTSDNYSLVVNGYSDASLGGLVFSNETELFFDSKQVSVFIITSKPFYNRGESVDFRVIPITKNMMPVTQSMDVRIKDPLGNVVREWFSQHTNAGGVVSLSYPLNRVFPRYSTEWLIEVKCLYKIYTKKFTIDEFYPPVRRINVSMPTHMMSDAIGLAGVAYASWTSHKPVRGNATIKLDILSVASNEKFSPIVRIIDYFAGEEDFLFPRQEIEAVAGGPSSLIGKELRVTLIMQDWFLNETYSGFQSAIVYDKDPQIKFLEGSAMVFRPDQPFSVHIAGQYGDGSIIPAHNPNRSVTVDIEEYGDFPEELRATRETVQLSVGESVAELWLYPSRQTQRFSLTAKYQGMEDTRRQLVATKHWSPTKSYLHITTATKRPKVEQFMNFDIVTNTYVDVIYYAITSGGNIILSDHLNMYARSRQLSIALSKDMVPTAKIVAYFITPERQVVADSLSFHVENNPAKSVTARINRGKDISYKNIELTLTADPLSYVAFGAMEYQLYDLGTRNGLTKEEVMDELYSYDKHSNSSLHHTWLRNGQADGSFYTHTGSFGHDANSTFFYAGLYLFTDANVSSVYTHCNRSKGEFPCMDGKTCYNYKDICTGKAECAVDHRDEMGCLNKTQPLVLYNDKHWRTKRVRNQFANPGFMWSEQFTKPDGRVDISFPILNYETSWWITVFSMSSENGLTILEKPLLLDDMRPMFMRVQAPGSVKLYEHLSLSIVVYNRWKEDLDVLVTVKGSPDYDPINWNRDNSTAIIGHGEHQIALPILANSQRQLYVPVRMRRVGMVSVNVEASSFVGSFSISQKVKVSHGGVTERYITNYQVNLRIANSERAPDLFIPVQEGLVDPEKRLLNYVPGSPRTVLHVVGDVIGVGFAPEFKNYITGRNLLLSPDYNCNNAIFSFAMNFYSLQNIRTLGEVTPEQTNAVIASLNSGLQEIFSYVNADGSFNMFRWSQKPSTWLTALFLDVFSDIKLKSGDIQRRMHIPQASLDKAALWLANQRGVVPGAIAEAGNINNNFFKSVLHIEVEGRKVPSNASLTALCVIAFFKSTQEDSQAQLQVADMKAKGADYIAKLAEKIDDPFEMAIVTYALIVADHKTHLRAFARLNELKRKVEQMTYWSIVNVPTIPIKPSLSTQVTLGSKQILNSTAYTVASTSYALLSYLLTGQPEDDIDDIQRFLQEQRMNVGGWASTYDTLIAVQALSNLAAKNQDRKTYDMTFTFRCDSKIDWEHHIHLNRYNWFTPQTVPLPIHWGTVQTYVSGHGVALLQMKTEVNHEHQEQFRKPAADYFDINYSLTTSGFNHSFIHYKVCPTWKGPGERSGIAVVDFTIPSGYAIPNGGTQNFCRINSKITSIRQGEARGSQVTIYFDYLDRSTDNCYQITSQRKRTASNITEHHYIRVFDYFEPGIYNETIIDRVEFSKLTVCLTCGSYQCPYCPDYAVGTQVTADIRLVISSFLLLCFHVYDSGVTLYNIF